MRGLLTISGPVTVSKNWTLEALLHFYGEELREQYGRVQEVVAIRSKESRPGGPRPEEVRIWNNPNYFLPADKIVKLKHDERYVVGDCRGFPQAIDVGRLSRRGGLYYCEVFHTLGVQLNQHPYIVNRFAVYNVFLTPIKAEKFLALKDKGVDIKQYAIALVARRVALRSEANGEDVYSPSVEEDNLKRALGSVDEFRSAPRFSHRLYAPYPEPHPFWHRKPNGGFCRRPEGCVMKHVDALAEIALTGHTLYSEHWPKELFV